MSGCETHRVEYVLGLAKNSRLADCLEVFRDDPGVAVVTTALNFVDEQGDPIQNRWHERGKAFYQEMGDLSLALVNGNFLMTTSNIFARRSLFHEFGGFSALRYAHDLEFFLRVLVRGKQYRSAIGTGPARG